MITPIEHPPPPSPLLHQPLQLYVVHALHEVLPDLSGKSQNIIFATKVVFNFVFLEGKNSSFARDLVRTVAMYKRRKILFLHNSIGFSFDRIFIP